MIPRIKLAALTPIRAAGIVRAMATAETPPLALRRWKRIEYERLVETGVFDSDERLELLDGLLVVREPQGVPHAAATRLVVAALRRTFGEGWLVDSQMPLALDDDSEPEPDICVVPGGPRDPPRSSALVRGPVWLELPHGRDPACSGDDLAARRPGREHRGLRSPALS